MPKRIIKRYSPKPETLQNHPHLQFLGSTLLNPNLWYINRKNASAAVAVGLFCAWMPIPFQMVLAAILAMLFSANLPFSVALVWLSNPLTMPPLFYGAYKLGAYILGIPLIEFHFELSFSWIIEMFETIAGPLLLGCFILAFASSIIGYFSMTITWRWNVARKWKKRRHK